MSKFFPHFGRTIKGKKSHTSPSLHSPTAPTAKPEQNWRELYEASLLELDRTKLSERVRAALEAIHRRLAQENETLSWEEYVEIEDALRALVRRAA